MKILERCKIEKVRYGIITLGNIGGSHLKNFMDGEVETTLANYGVSGYTFEMTANGVTNAKGVDKTFEKNGLMAMTAVMLDIPADNYTTQIDCKLYIEVNYADVDGAQKVYAVANDNVRSIQYVAAGLLEDTEYIAGLESKQVELLQMYAGQ